MARDIETGHSLEVGLVASATLAHGAALPCAYSADFLTSMQTQAMPRLFHQEPIRRFNHPQQVAVPLLCCDLT